MFMILATFCLVKSDDLRANSTSCVCSGASSFILAAPLATCSASWSCLSGMSRPRSTQSEYADTSLRRELLDCSSSAFLGSVSGDDLALGLVVGSLREEAEDTHGKGACWMTEPWSVSRRSLISWHVKSL